MADYIILVVKRLGIFTVAAQTLLHFCPNKTYERYIKVLIGTMTIVLLTVPILGLVKGDVEGEIQRRLEAYGSDMEAYLKKQDMDISYQEVAVEEYTKKEVEEKLNTILEEYHVKIDRMEEKGDVLYLTLSELSENKGETIEEQEIKEKLTSQLGLETKELEVMLYEGRKEKVSME